MCEYPIIAPPFTLRFREMTKQELEDYNEWFHKQIPGRVAILERAVRCTPGFEDWKGDYSPESLDKLGMWFAGAVEKRPRTEEEIAKVRGGLKERFKALPVNDWELTNKTYSLAIDAGMYIGQVFLKNVTNLKWYHTTKGRRDWDSYGQPVIAGFGPEELQPFSFNPVRIMVSLARGILSGERGGERLRRIYEIWKGMAEKAKSTG